MKSVEDVVIDKDEFLTAEQLRGMTATQEELFEQKVYDIKTNFMSTMVQKATTQGSTGYQAIFRREADTGVLDKVKSAFIALGYKVTTKDRIQEMEGNKIDVFNDELAKYLQIFNLIE